MSRIPWVVASLGIGLFALGSTQASADAPYMEHFDASTYWHHAWFFWDDQDLDALGAVVWTRDPDPAKAYAGQWCQSIEDCSTWECPVDVVGRMPRYPADRISGHVAWMDSDLDDPCHDVPASMHELLQGDDLVTWVFRGRDIQAAYFSFCEETVDRAYDDDGNPIFEGRRIAMRLMDFPRIASGNLDFQIIADEGAGAPHGDATISGNVLVERDPETLALLASPRQGAFRLHNTWAGQQLMDLEAWWGFLAEIGVECDSTRPNPSDSGIAHAGNGKALYDASLSLQSAPGRTR